ncbi:TPA: DUF2635 domain-containing protein [Serratia marcescens]|uniref:DUF2635 domain-containing protein n=1 Tax=Serratia marcescens TaxID=615 RepID=A0AB33G6A4_SERMA|nr:DUF2635 domain-containing protein [Serratia marcescens]AKL43307.1 hypothetical protein AB188_23465 [Serratia marcescens]AWL70659.1 DUF2635 domain-containing protein [Serratia marcescens]OCN21048.1 hypothetical protein AN699_0214400 [Serratia marcescens]OCN21798.1 hypothetical protein AN701_0214255 [Serratia marcescens]OCN44387.1 hypothetical protein AN658_0213355 [Serratia marcescens]
MLTAQPLRSNAVSDFTIKPAPGRAVRDPLTLALLPANGDRKPRSGYWLRRLIDGDVVEVETQKAKSPKPKDEAQ